MPTNGGSPGGSDAVKGNVEDVHEIYTEFKFLHQKPRRGPIRIALDKILRRRRRLVRGPESLGPLAVQHQLEASLRYLGVNHPLPNLLDAGSGDGQLCAATTAQH